MTAEPQQSEFGRGLTYCLGLFLMHAERERHGLDASLWFNGAADHLFELESVAAPETIRSRMDAFKGKCLRWRLHRGATEDDIEWALGEALFFLRQIDAAHGVNVVKAQWE